MIASDQSGWSREGQALFSVLPRQKGPLAGGGQPAGTRLKPAPTSCLEMPGCVATVTARNVQNRDVRDVIARAQHLSACL
jgi:hypothetical protein